MREIFSFQPLSGGNATASLAVGTSAANVPLPGLPSDGASVRLVNSGTQVVFLNFTGAASSSTSMPMLPNTVETFSLPPTATISAIAAATGSTLYATVGEGT